METTIILLSFWLLAIFYTCCSLYCFASYQPAKLQTKQPALAEAKQPEPTLAELVQSEKDTNQGQLAAAKRSASPNRPLYYASIGKPNPVWHYDKNFHIVNHYKASYPGYNGKGYGYIKLHINGYYTDWLATHYAKYPGGILPEQTIIRGRVK